MRFDTLAIHHAQDPDPSTGALVTPIVQTSTFAQTAPGVHRGYDYSRTSNPTREKLEHVLAVLEGGAAAAAFASGIAAEHALLQAFTRPGDHVVTAPDVYGGTFRLLDAVHGPRGLSWSRTDLSDDDALRAALRPGTKLVWLESPTNPRLLVFDIERVARITHEHGALLVVDNTFASPVNQRPIALGADLVVHSVTKYLAGHSDLVQGAVVARDATLLDPVRYLQNATGGVPSPFDCWLALRGLKTLSLRVERHNANALAVAHAVEGHPVVRRVHYPFLPSHPGHAIAVRQSRGGGGVVSLELRGDERDARRFVSSLRYFALAESLGGVRSLVCHPATMTHAAIPADARHELGLSDTLVRLSVGLEDPLDLIEDLRAALDALSAQPLAAAPSVDSSHR